jgi:PAS domain S-box-containing protein
MDSKLQTQTEAVVNTRPWKLIVIMLFVTGAIALSLYNLSNAYVIHQAEKNIQNLLLSHKGVHYYIQQDAHQAFYRLKDNNEIKQEMFLPELVSSSYIVRNIHKCYNTERRKHGLPEFYYKLAAINPRNPVNQADESEKKLIEIFNAKKDLKEYHKTIEIDGKKYLYYALPFLKTRESCLKCHGDHQIAPKQLQDRYKGNGGFNDKIGNIRAIESIRIPLESEFKIAHVVFIALLSGFMFLFFLLFFNRRQKKIIKVRTKNLEHEISERLQAEAAMRESEEKYRLLMKNLPGVVYRGYRDWSVEFIDKKIEQLTGYTVEEFNSRQIIWSDIIFQEDIKAVSNYFHKALRTKDQSFVREYRIKARDGSIYWIQDRGQVISNGEEVEYISGVFYDITKQKQTEEESLLLATAIEHAAESVIISNRIGTIQYVNPAFKQLSGFSKEDIVGQNFRILRSDKHDKGFYKEMWEVISRGKIWSGLITNRMKDNTLREFETKISPVQNDSGDIVSFVSVNRDVTQEKVLEAQLQQAHRMQSIGTLAGGIAHDFNNILSAIIGYTELTIDYLENGSLPHNNLQEVLEAGERAKGLINQILTFSRQSEQDLKPLQLKLIVIETLKLIRATLPSTIEIHQDLQSDGAILGDQIKIHQVLMNLCTNASHAMMEKGGVLSVSLSDVELDSNFIVKHFDIKSGSYIKLSVSDTGHGMPSSLLERIFDPFFTTKEKGKGTGMGLSVVHGIVKSHSGTVHVYSEPGEGSTFNVYLPIIEKQLEQKIRAEKPIPTGTEHILLVDDEESLINMGKQSLVSLGYNVTTRINSIEALELFKTKPDTFDLVITDLTMPNMTGDELAIKLMAIRLDIPVILCTGFSTRITEEKAKSMGIRAFIMKPLIRKDIAETIRKVLDHNQ